MAEKFNCWNSRFVEKAAASMYELCIACGKRVKDGAISVEFGHDGFRAADGEWDIAGSFYFGPDCFAKFYGKDGQ